MYFVVAVFFQVPSFRALSLHIKRVSLLVRDLLSREIHSLYSLHIELGILHNALGNSATSAAEITQISDFYFLHSFKRLLQNLQYITSEKEKTKQQIT